MKADKLYRLQPKNWKLRERLMFFFSILIVVPIGLIIMINYMSQTKELKANVRRYSEVLIHQASSNIDYYITDANELINAIFLNPYIDEQFAIIENETSNSYQKIRAELSINDQLSSLAKTKEYINNFYLLDRRGTPYSSLNFVDAEVLLEREWVLEVFNGDKKKAYQYVSDVKDYLGDTNLAYSAESVLVILMQYMNSDRNEQIGVIGIEINSDVLVNIMENVNKFPDSVAMLLDDQGKVIQSTGDVVLSDADLELVYEEEQGSIIKDKHLIVYDSLAIKGWKLVQINSLEQVLENSIKTSQTTIFIGIFFLVFAELLALAIAWQLSKPMIELMGQMKKVESGDFDTAIAIKGNDEIGQLSIRFNKMVQRLEGLIKRIQYEEQEKRQVELRLLHEQINPHFLYNTLNSMVWLSRIQKAPAITEGLKSLIHLLKNTIHSGDETITVAEEIDFIKNYIIIQKLRYGDRFELTYDVASEVLDYKMLKLLIQPIIENALLHGIDLESFDNRIDIQVKVQDGSLSFSVRDNGQGMNSEALQTLMTEDHPFEDGMRHIGIHNIIQRIKLHYGEDYYLTIDSTEGVGTTVYAILPVIK